MKTVARDVDQVVAELEAKGWQFTRSGNVTVGIHPDADRPLRFGGQYGMNLRRIREQAAALTGERSKRENRRQVTTRHDVAERARNAASRDRYLAQRTAAQMDDQRRLQLMRAEDNYRFYADLMMPGR